MNNYNQGVNTPNFNQPVGNSNNGSSFIDNIPKDKTSIIGYAGVLVAIIANFLDFVVVKASAYGYSASSSFSYVSTSSGKLVLVLFIATAILIALRKHAHSAIPAGLATIIFIYNFATVKNQSASYKSSYVTINYGPGIWLTLVGIVLIAASIYLYWKANPDCFKNLKFSKANTAPAPQPIMNQNNQPTMNQFNQPVNNINTPAQNVPVNNFNTPVQNVPVNNINTPVGQTPVDNIGVQNPQINNINEQVQNPVDQNNQFNNMQ